MPIRARIPYNRYRQANEDQPSPSPATPSCNITLQFRNLTRPHSSPTSLCGQTRRLTLEPKERGGSEEMRRPPTNSPTRRLRPSASKKVLYAFFNGKSKSLPSSRLQPEDFMTFLNWERKRRGLPSLAEKLRGWWIRSEKRG